MPTKEDLERMHAKGELNIDAIASMIHNGVVLPPSVAEFVMSHSELFFPKYGYDFYEVRR